MPGSWWAALGVAAALCAHGEAAAQESRYAGEWSGKYVCRQGVTAMQVVVEATGADGVRALVHFFPTAENPRVAEGCFTMTGLFERGSGQLSLRRERWIVQPRGYAIPEFDGTIDGGGLTFSGRLTGVAGCATFSLTRDPSPRALPAACAARGSR